MVVRFISDRRWVVPPSNGVVPLSNGVVPPSIGVVPPSIGVLPPSIGVVPPSNGVLPPIVLEHFGPDLSASMLPGRTWLGLAGPGP